MNRHGAPMRTPVAVTVALCFFISMCQLCAASTSLDEECAALILFYRSLSNSASPWTNSSGWEAGASSSNTATVSSCCSWYGVSCDVTQSTVVALQLVDNNLQGQLIDDVVWVSQLPNISIIDFSMNPITGQLPASFYAFQRLTSIKIEGAQLTGSLPLSWRALPSLLNLSLSYNHLSGSIPDEYSEIATLRWAYLGHNQLSGSVPKWNTCTLLLCGNTAMSTDMDTMDWSSYSGAWKKCKAGVTLYLVGIGLTGHVPCIPNVTLLELSYTAVKGPVPCCNQLTYLGLPAPIQLTYLGLEGCANVTGFWQDTSSCPSSPKLEMLGISGSGIRSLPVDMNSRFPSLTMLVARDLYISQPLPALPRTLQVLDIAGNAFSAPTLAAAVINISLSHFVYMDLTSTSSGGITLVDTVLECVDQASDTSHSGSNCAVKLDVFRAISKSLFEQGNPPPSTMTTSSSSSGAPDTIPASLVLQDYTAVPTPMMMVFPNYLIGFHTILTFMSPWFTGMYNPRLMVDQYLPHVSLADNAFSSTGALPLAWNNTFAPILPCPSGFVVFDGLAQTTSSLLFGVVYRLDVTFSYKPVRLPNGAIGTYTKDLAGGTVQAPPCNPTSLYAVPLTTVCAACPPLAVCDGSSLLHADGLVWRSKASYLPFYTCENNGCVQASASNTSVQRDGTECAGGFTGPLCSVCSANHGLDTTGNCVSCSANGWNWTILVVGALAFIGAATFASLNGVPQASGNAHSVAFQEQHHNDKRGKEHAPKKILSIDEEEEDPKDLAAVETLSEEKAHSEEEHKDQLAKRAAVVVKHLQNHLGMFAAIGRTVYAKDRSNPSVAIQTIQQFASQISLRSISFVTCLFPDFTSITQFQALLIIIPSLTLLELAVVRWRRQRWAWVAVTSSVLLLLYESTITMTLQLIPTDEMVFYDATQFTINNTGAVPLEVINTLSLDRRVFVDDTATKGWQVTAYVWLFLFGVGFPLGVIACYVRMTTNYGLQYAKDNLGFLTSNFRTKRWYWEEAIMLRKFVLAVGVIGLRNYPLAQMQAIIAGLMMYVVGLEWQVPFASTWLHHAERVSCYSALIVANVLMAKGSLKNSEADQASAYQGEAYTSFVAVMQVVSFLGVCLLLYIEWRRSAALGFSLEDSEGGEEGSQRSVFPINLDLLNFDGSYFKGFSMSRVSQYLSGPTPAATKPQQQQASEMTPRSADFASPESVKDLL